MKATKQGLWPFLQLPCNVPTSARPAPARGVLSVSLLAPIMRRPLDPTQNTPTSNMCQAHMQQTMHHYQA
eukprot:1843191-Amphidinium_carterae.1